MKVYGQLERAQFENVGALPPAGIKGRTVFLTTNSKFYFDDGTTFREELSPTTTAGDMIVRNGTADARFPVGTDGQVPVVDTTLGNKIRWATLQQGAKNYVTYNNFENNSTTGWTSSAATWSGSGPTGGPSLGGGVTLAITGSNPLQGTLSLQANSWTVQGQGFLSDSLTIDIEDQSRVLQGSFYYSVPTNAANGNFSGTSANTIAVWIYDINNSAWIQPQGVYNLTQKTGVGFCTYTFQTPSNGTSFRIFIVAANAASGAGITMAFDDFYLGPQKVVYGAPVTSPGDVAWTPTGSWSTNTTYTGQYWRVGKMMKGWVKVATAGAPTSATLSINLPAGVSVDTSVYDADTDNYVIGNASLIDSGINSYPGRVRYFSTTSLEVDYITSTDVFAPVTQAAPFTYGAGDEAHIEFEVPISGWSSNTVMSSDTDTRIVAFSGRKSATQTGINTNASSVAITFITTASGANGFDTHGAWDGTSTWTCPVSGFYNLNAFLEIASTNVLNNDYTLYFTIAGTDIQADFIRTGAVTVPLELKGTGTFYILAGQTVILKLNGTGNNSVSTLTANATSRFSITKQTGPATIAANETVAAAAYRNTSSQTITAGGALTAIVFNAIDNDSHGMFNTVTGIYTAPTSGRYLVSYNAEVTMGATAASTVNTTVLKNGAGKNYGYIAPDSFVNSKTYHLTTTCFVRCVAGDTLGVYALCTGQNVTLDFTGSTNDVTSVYICRVGN